MRKNPWMENSIKNLIPLSAANDFKEALKEWEFTGEVIDHQIADETCELCEHEELRYHFEIINYLKLNHLWVGSSCILRFQEIVVYDESGMQLTDARTRKRELDRALKDKQVDIALQPLRILWKIDREYRKYIEMSVSHFKSKGAFTPQNLVVLCEKMHKNDIKYQPSMFPVYLRTRECKAYLRTLKDDQLNYVLQCMSSQQRERFAV
ncbi:hypothetical protein [Rheinheimera sp.]|uniref:hypothetical protein n=1 Tax=Rheinheimera sp. TaxID=1869214 RepID=UPI00273256DE|nr:hypothetical protein [Rheinheimera sp.]MDP2714439.1 hypothetical protein [Rheinheimera sp.]